MNCKIFSGKNREERCFKNQDRLVGGKIKDFFGIVLKDPSPRSPSLRNAEKGKSNSGSLDCWSRTVLKDCSFEMAVFCIVSSLFSNARIKRVYCDLPLLKF